jgi:hypothetical protein
MKYLKRILHAPRSTPNVAVYVELGVMPIEYEIHIRQLNFLHHVLSFDENDPVKKVYNQTKRYKHEENWPQEIRGLLKKYQLEEDENLIRNTGKEVWKQTVFNEVTSLVADELNTSCCKGSMTKDLSCLEDISMKDYFRNMAPSEARLLFAMRSNIIDLRGVRKYMYKDSTCRLCKNGDEDVDHVINRCAKIGRRELMDMKELFQEDILKLKEMVKRMKEFIHEIDELEDSKIEMT